MTNKQVTDNSEYFGYKIDHTAYIEVTRERNIDEEYSGEDTSTNWNIFSSLTIDNNYPDITTPFEIEEDKDYYLVYVIYNTGDSFSYHDGSNVEFIEIFENYDKATSLVHQIKSNTNLENLNGEYLDEKDNKKNLSFCWYGCFESLSICEVMRVNIPILNPEIQSNKKKYKNN